MNRLSFGLRYDFFLPCKNIHTRHTLWVQYYWNKLNTHECTHQKTAYVEPVDDDDDNG